ncbi:MAG: universal stress protein [Vicinamibacterales bacterium]
MITLKNVLVPTDFSEPSAVALKYGLALAEAFGARLHLLHAVEDPFTYPWAAEAYVNPDEIVARHRQEASAEMRKLVTDEQRTKYDVQFVVDIARPFLSVVDYAKKHDVDLIVMGTHGRGAIAHLLIGSVAENVVRKAPCPVLTVRSQEHEFVVP